jgi:fluoride exporter
VIWLAVALAGAAGSVLRYAVGLALLRVAVGFPAGTLLVNVLGSFLLGLFARWLGAPSIDPAWRIALTVGFCGGFTTFSTFSAELVSMAQEGRFGRAAAYVLTSLVLGVTATLLGLAMGDRLLSAVRS